MKTQFQTLSFLSNYAPKTDLDREFIDSFLVQRFQITPKTPRFAPNFDASPLDVQSFISWFESGSAALKMASFENRPVILGNCTLETCEIIGTLMPDGGIDTAVRTVGQGQISDLSELGVDSMERALLDNGLQPDPNTLRLVPKYIPRHAERVVFYDFSQSVQGVGVVREIRAGDDVVFFCYFTYPTPERPRRIGYNLFENPGFNLRSFVFESIDRENIQTTLGNSTSCYRRLGKELEREGKVWKDKLRRIEPVEMFAEVGKTYYYIDDKMRVRPEREKGTPTSRFRYIAGNYFTDQMAANKMVGIFNDLLRGYLASGEWPEIRDWKSWEF